MRAAAFLRAVTADRSDLLGSVVRSRGDARIPFCVVGGQAVNAYVEPLVSLDLDLAVAEGRVEEAVAALGPAVRVERFPHSVNLASDGSDLRVQFQTDGRYAAFVERASERDVLGVRLPVAAVEDVPSVSKSVDLTESSDPNDMLGRPNGYKAATVFYDKRANCDELGVECGATLEIWPDSSAAK